MDYNRISVGGRFLRVRQSKWAQATRLQRRLGGFFSFLFCAFSALIRPEVTDAALFVVLGEQFEDLGPDKEELC